MASILFGIGAAVMDTLAFSGINFVFSKLMDHWWKEMQKT